LALLWTALPAGAVLIETGDGTGNTSAPPACPAMPVCDPGWDHVGVTANHNTVVYLRNRWVITANHVTPNSVILGGSTYGLLVGSEIRLDNGDGTYPDLQIFGLTTDPGLPELPIRSLAVSASDLVIMIGGGRDRGAATDSDDPSIWQPPPDPPETPIPGWLWAATKSKRWGVNRITDLLDPDPLDTVSFFTTFDDPTAPAHVSDEAQAADGDSGGGAFVKQGNTWELAGILFAVGTYDGHLNNSALRGEATIIADLTHYRQQILDLTASEPVPEPSGLAGLFAGLALLATLGRGRMRA